jgi:hypothetical protein
MRRLQLARSTSAPPSAASLLLNRRTFIGGFGSAVAVIVLANAAPRPATAASEGWTVPGITEGGIDVDGKRARRMVPAA